MLLYISYPIFSPFVTNEFGSYFIFRVDVELLLSVCSDFTKILGLDNILKSPKICILAQLLSYGKRYLIVARAHFVQIPVSGQ